ncbi:MAG: hypothetical protein ACE5IH_00185 [Thermodesulfobacteriota bacterium]
MDKKEVFFVLFCDQQGKKIIADNNKFEPVGKAVPGNIKAGL